ncbi:hypothetical protein [Aestuariivirga sp.]|uniref:hypothetical protein n=1 Tax=Aestuariivirga sp. TaxID=2650926 RepID=UPI003BAD083F
MLTWFRLRKPIERIHRICVRPLHILESRQPALMRTLWKSPYCCTLLYFWTAVVAEDICRNTFTDEEKRQALRDAFARIVEDSHGAVNGALNRVLPDGNPVRRRALSDLKRVVDLYRGDVDDRCMIYPGYREAVYEDGRPAFPGNRWGLRKEVAHEILLFTCLARNLQPEDERALAFASQ